MKRILLAFLALACSIQMTWAQQRTITGKVTSSDDPSGLPGVNVLIQGTSSGTVTDVSGNYSIEANQGDVLSFSSVGFISEQMTVGNQSTIDITLIADITALDEIVVVGYGTLAKRDLTGSVTSVRSADLAKVGSQSIDVALQGQGSGIQVNTSSGVPGAPTRVMVRGTNSMSSATEPLWVVDGLIIDQQVAGIGGDRGGMPQNPLASINPNDIESIEVLKDAAATAIYGARGSNGVILVTTKTGKGGKGTLDISYQQGVSDLTRSPSQMNFMNGSEMLATLDKARINAGLGELDPTAHLARVNPAVDVNDPNIALTRADITGVNTNWFDQILRKGSFQEFNISTSKPFEKGSLFISANYRDDKGVLKNNDFKRISTRINAEYQPVNNLTTGVRLTLAYTGNTRVKASGGGIPSGNDQVGKGGFGEANGSALPFFPVMRDGAYWNPRSGVNLAASIDDQNQLDELLTYRALGGVYVNYDMPFLEGLSIRSEGSFDMLLSHSNYWASAEIRPDNSAYGFDNKNLRQNFNYNLYATYNKRFDKHNINLVVGTESQISGAYVSNLEGVNITTPARQLGAPGEILRGSAGFGGERYQRGFFGRANYTFDGRYIAGVSFRRDASSIFREEFRWGTFPAASAAWVISEESFMSGLGNTLSYLKLRGSYGQTGNQEIGTSATFTTFLNWPAYANHQQAFIVSNLGSTDLVWEKTDALDVALDFGMFSDRITGSLGYYQQRVNDLLFNVDVPASSGLQFAGNNIWANVANMRNSGLEFNIRSINVDSRDFKWTTEFNITTNRNEILSITDAIDENGAGIISGVTLSRTGGRIGAFYMVEHAGVDPELGVEMIYAADNNRFLDDGAINPNFQKRSLDEDGNPIIIPAHRNNINNNRQLFEDKAGMPTFFGGLNNTFTYKMFELTAFFTFQGGNYIYDAGEQSRSIVGVGGNILSRELLDNSWEQPGDIAKYPKLIWNWRYDVNQNGDLVTDGDGNPNFNQRYDLNNSTRHLHKGDFIRLRVLQLACNLPNQLTEKIHVKNMRIFLAANNLLTITSFKGWDPEQATVSGGAQSRNLQQGVVNPIIPQLRSFSAGVNFSF
ncbi:MAG: SusC/RagA family TonB-linked outer membrane protein [Cyclobacteriaceae bacterium]